VGERRRVGAHGLYKGGDGAKGQLIKIHIDSRGGGEGEREVEEERRGVGEEVGGIQ
jgi:hypothetical protein